MEICKWQLSSVVLGPEMAYHIYDITRQCRSRLSLPVTYGSCKIIIIIIIFFFDESLPVTYLHAPKFFIEKCDELLERMFHAYLILFNQSILKLHLLISFFLIT
jgi:hypothetical protein